MMLSTQAMRGGLLKSLRARRRKVTVSVWDLSSGTFINDLDCQPSFQALVLPSPDSHTVAAHGGRELVLIGLPEFRIIGALPLPAGTHDISGIEFTSDGRALIANCHRPQQTPVRTIWTAGRSREPEAKPARWSGP